EDSDDPAPRVAGDLGADEVHRAAVLGEERAEVLEHRQGGGMDRIERAELLPSDLEAVQRSLQIAMEAVQRFGRAGRLGGELPADQFPQVRARKREAGGIPILDLVEGL